MAHPLPDSILGEGKYLRLVRRNGWEHVERTHPVGAAFIGAVTDEGKILLTREFRVPLQCEVIGCPAGLIGDSGDPQEAMQTGVIRELEEEAGYTATNVRLVTRGPTSPGLSTEVIDIVLAEGLTRVGNGGGIHDEQISIVEVPLTEVDEWLEAQVKKGELIDPKVYAVLYYLRKG